MFEFSRYRRDKDWLQHPEMTRGQKLYANAIAKVYDMTNMKQLKQAQYVQLIHREQQRGTTLAYTASLCSFILP